MKLEAMQRLIMSMSYKKSDAESRIRALDDDIYEHAILLILFPHASSVNHWKTEMNAWMRRCLRYTNLKGGKFSESDVKKFLTEGPEHLSLTVKGLTSDYAFKARDLSLDQIYERLDNFYDLLAAYAVTRNENASLEPLYKALMS